MPLDGSRNSNSTYFPARQPIVGDSVGSSCGHLGIVVRDDYDSVCGCVSFFRHRKARTEHIHNMGQQNSTIEQARDDVNFASVFLALTKHTPECVCMVHTSLTIDCKVLILCFAPDVDLCILVHRLLT
jgi:hypothetical protein